MLTVGSAAARRQTRTSVWTDSSSAGLHSVIPAKAGIQESLHGQAVCIYRRVWWIPACAGMTGSPSPFFAGATDGLSPRLQSL